MSMRQEPEFYALVDEPNADDAYLATLSALYDPVVVNDPKRHRYEFDITTEGASLGELLAVKREALRRGYAGTRIPFRTRSRKILLDVTIVIKRVKRAHNGGSGSPIRLLSVEQADILPQGFAFPASCHEVSVPAGAAILGRVWQDHLDRVFLALCAPDTRPCVKMGAYNMLDKFYGIDLDATGTSGWYAAVEMAGTYHSNHEVARDLAFSWLHIHDSCPVDSVVHLSLDELCTLVEAAPRESSIGISSQTQHVVKHGLDQSRACTMTEAQATPMNWSAGPRPRYPEDNELTREHVLTTLQTPSETLLHALEAVAATPEPEWVEAEDQGLNVLTAPGECHPTWAQGLDLLEQRSFLEQHGPFQVRRLPNGGVMLNAYPYRYLWPLWARALDLLGIRPLKA